MCRGFIVIWPKIYCVKNNISTTRILGIDPGFDRTGFGVVEAHGSDATWVAHGCLNTSKESSFSVRLQHMRDQLVEVIQTYQPAGVAVEQLFFQTNVKTAMKVGMARGVILLAIADAELPIVEITPNQVKQGLTGWGSADKKGIQMMVQKFLKLKEIPKPDDAADALAIAIVGGLLFRHHI
jgi:crossover junction endodeoxyribonuclease RuvC